MQEPTLFSRTIAENIGYGVDGAGQRDITAAAALACADEFIDRLPGGYAAPVGDRGVQLSGGQRQRLAIARAVLRRPHILILDEATSALDAELESVVQVALRTLDYRPTTLIIAHRLSTVANVDRVDRPRRRPNRRERHPRRAASVLDVLPAARADTARTAMNAAAEWYRSDRSTPPPDLLHPSVGRRLRNWLRSWLPEPDVGGKTIVLYARQGYRRMSAWAGLFSEFHSVVGALAYAEARGAAGVRVDFRSALYVDPAHGPNWWTYFFERDLMTIGSRSSSGEVHLDRPLAKYGRHGGFCDVVNGRTPYLYPMTYGVSRADVHRLVASHIHVRQPILDEVARAIAASTEPDAYVVAVHYRGTDSTRRSGLFTDNQTKRVSYQAYADEVRRALESAAPSRVSGVRGER